jgi:hypothetical protein
MNLSQEVNVIVALAKQKDKRKRNKFFSVTAYLYISRKYFKQFPEISVIPMNVFEVQVFKVSL